MLIMKKLKGKLTISRYTGRPKGSGITISLIDDTSHCECVEIEVTADVFGNAITGQSHLPCEFEWRPANVGKGQEQKYEIISFAYGSYNTREKEAREALKPYEVDGWIGDWSDLCNHHRATGKDAYRVGFHRYVDLPHGQKGDG